MRSLNWINDNVGITTAGDAVYTVSTETDGSIRVRRNGQPIPVIARTLLEGRILAENDLAQHRSPLLFR